MSLLDQISGLIGQKEMSQMAQHVGADEQSVGKAISAALPTLMGAMGRKADSDDGQGMLQQWFEKSGADADASADHFKNAEPESDAGGLLDGLFGGNRQRVENGIGSASGLSSGQAGGLMKMLAPFLMAQFSQRGQQSGGAGGIGGILDLMRGGGKEAEERSGTGGLVGKLLDQDGDGDFDFSDMAKFGMSLFTRKS